MAERPSLPLAHVSGVIEMALWDHVSFETIEVEYGLNESAVKAQMRDSLKSSSYRSWRKRGRRFGARREDYK
jgi:uncharacterized protein (TIGR03643 family)